jgi:hypothetical protein
LSSGVCHLFPTTSASTNAVTAPSLASTQVDSDEDPEDEYKAESEAPVNVDTDSTSADPEVPVKGKKRVKKLAGEK